MPFEINEAYLTLAGTIFGGLGLKIGEKILGRGKDKNDIATKLRTELRTDNSELRAEVNKLEDAMDEWRNKYYALVAQMARRGIPICLDDNNEPE
jgi:FtsZ-binding cell division protein ZapB